MPELTPLKALPPEAGSIRKNGHTGEPLTIDQSTFEIKGANSGKVYGKGRNLQEALGLQTQMQSGGTPTVGGRPDLYAVSPLPSEKVNPIAGPNGQPVTPRVATLDELGKAAGGTLPSFNAANPAATPAAPANFADTMRSVVEAGANAGRDKLFSTDKGGSFDNQLLVQRGVLMSALFGDSSTPEDLRFLSPEQQAAIRTGKKDAIEAQVIGLNSVISSRRTALKDEEDRQRQQRTDAISSFTTLKTLGLLGSMTDETINSLATQLGLDPSAIKDVITAEKAGVQWQIGSDPDGNLVMYKFDPATGTYESKVIQKKTKSSGGGPGAGKPNIKFIEGANGGQTMLVYDDYGNVVSTQDVIPDGPNKQDYMQQLDSAISSTFQDISGSDARFGSLSTELDKATNNAVATFGDVLDESYIKSRIADRASVELDREASFWTPQANERIKYTPE